MQITPQMLTKIATTDLSKSKILVVGDVMLDRYWRGEVERISPEAPVPIAKITQTQDSAGGAANVARNIAVLGGDVTLLSVIGDDEAGDTLATILEDDNVQTIFKRTSLIKTIIKLRVTAKTQQLIRLDFEEMPSSQLLEELIKDYQAIVADYDLIILSDYAKGVLTNVSRFIELANMYNKITLVDPKGKDYKKYCAATLITPNQYELIEAYGHWEDEQELSAIVFQVRQELQLQHLLLTRSEEGMSLYTAGNTVFHYPTIAQEVFDVSGAGDTVIATLGLMLANQIDIQNAVCAANVAAGIVVSKLGTATVTRDELLEQMKNIIYSCK